MLVDSAVSPSVIRIFFDSFLLFIISNFPIGILYSDYKEKTRESSHVSGDRDILSVLIFK